MFLLVLSALRARRSQTIALFALTVLAGLGASAAPWYAGWARDAVTRANIAAAPAEQRIVAAAGAVRLGSGGPDPLVTLRQRVGQQLDIPGSDVVVGARLYATMSPAGGPRTPSAGEGSQASGLYLTYRDRVCEQLTIEGACPGAAGDVVIGKATAAALGLAVGDQVRFEGFRLPAPAVLRISGVYEVADLLSPYWAGTDLLTGGSAGAAVDDPAFVSADTLFAARPDGLDTDFHLVLPEAAFMDAGPGAGQGAGGDAGLASTLARATAALRQANLEVRTDAVTLIDQIRRDRRLVALGILVATVQLVLLCWVGLFLAVRHTSDDRQGDIGLLKLRGAPAWRTWALAAQQSALPMVAGALVGWVLGYLAASALAGTPAKGGALGLSLLAVALACLGALVAAVVAEWRSLGAPVVTLLRRVPERHRGWRADVVELVVVLLAVAGVYQGHAEISSDGEPSVLALLAPGLVGLAVALLVARAMPAVAARLGLNALGRGQPGAALAALHLARRPGTHRIFAVLAVAVSVFITVVLFWHAAGVAWSDRAVQELGAARVLTVRAPNSTQLLAAVRAVDPDGRVAMAVARTQGVRTEDRIVAVDSSRLAAVAQLPGQDPAELARRLHPPVPTAPTIGDGPLTLEAQGQPGLAADETVTLRLNLSTVDGVARVADFGALEAGRRTYAVVVSGCPAGCRLVGLELVAPRLLNVGKDVTVQVYGLSQPGGGVDPAALADVTRWRPPLGPVGIGPIVTAHEGRLALSLYTGPKPPGQRIDPRLMVNAAPAPLPVVLAGARAEQRRAGDDRVSVLGGTRVPYQVVASAPVLPRVGASGALVDLEYAQRSNDSAAESAALEVWLTADAPDSVLAGLRERGVRIVSEETVASRAAELARHGPGLALRFELFAAAVLLLLGAGTVIVAAAVERRSRVEELRALRAQGLDRRAATVAGYVGTGALIALAVGTGTVAALVAEAAATASLPFFADGWALLPAPPGIAIVPLLGALVVALIVLGAAAAGGASRVLDGVLSEPRGEGP